MPLAQTCSVAAALLQGRPPLHRPPLLWLRHPAAGAKVQEARSTSVAGAAAPKLQALTSSAGEERRRPGLTSSVGEERRRPGLTSLVGEEPQRLVRQSVPQEEMQWEGHSMHLRLRLHLRRYLLRPI